MATQGEAKTPREKRMVKFNYGGAMLGVMIGGLSGVPLFGHFMGPVAGAVTGVVLGALVGYFLGTLLRVASRREAK